MITPINLDNNGNNVWREKHSNKPLSENWRLFQLMTLSLPLGILSAKASLYWVYLNQRIFSCKFVYWFYQTFRFSILLMLVFLYKVLVLKSIKTKKTFVHFRLLFLFQHRKMNDKNFRANGLTFQNELFEIQTFLLVKFCTRINKIF